MYDIKWQLGERVRIKSHPSNYTLIFDGTIAVNAPCLFPRRFRPSFSTSKELGIHFRMHNQAGTSEFIADSGYFSRAKYMRVRPRDSRASGQNYRRLFFFIMPASNTNLTRLPRRRRRQLKIVSRRRAVTKRTENDGQPDWQRLCTRHYPLQVLRAAAYLHVSANAAQPRDTVTSCTAKGKRRKEKKRKKRTDKKRKDREEKPRLRGRGEENSGWNDFADAFPFGSEMRRTGRAFR